MKGEFLLEVSRGIKEQRKKKRLTLQKLADMSGVTKSLISQIENGRKIPSLPVLLNLLGSLEIEVSTFFKNLSVQEPTIIVKRAEDYKPFTKENTPGFLYNRILSRSIHTSTLDFVILELMPDTQRKLVTTEAFEFKYILDGEVEYQINGSMYTLKKGDSLFFDGRLAHVPVNRKTTPCTMLIVYFFIQE